MVDPKDAYDAGKIPAVGTRCTSKRSLAKFITSNTTKCLLIDVSSNLRLRTGGGSWADPTNASEGGWPGF